MKTYNFCRNIEHYEQLCRRCLNTYGDQTKLEEHMLRCIEQKVCNISYMQPNQNIKFNDWYMEIDTPMWIAADFECMNFPINDNTNKNDDDNNNDNVNVKDLDNNGVTDKLFINKPVAIGYNIAKNPDFENLNLEKDGYIKYLEKIVLNGL